MCFSATASFIAGGSLTALGVLTIKKARCKSELPFAAVPFLFGIQQLIEGILWLAMQQDIVLLKTITTYLFTIFSHLLWPAYIPFAIALMEQDMKPWRKNAMWGFRFVGIMVAIHLFVQIAMQPLMAVVNEHIIYVSPFFYEWPMMVFYIVATCMVAFFSTHTLIRFFGLLTLFFFAISYWIYSEALFSVWCFFAAAGSLIIYVHFSRSYAGRGKVM